MQDHAAETTKLFRETLTNQWIVSGNKKDQVLGMAIGSELISSVEEAYYIYEETTENLVIKVRSILSDLKSFRIEATVVGAQVLADVQAEKNKGRGKKRFRRR